MMSYLRKYFVSGLLVWLPIWVTILVVKFVVDILDSTFLLLPKTLRPDYFLGYHIPGMGVLLTVAVIILTGILAANFFGSQLVALWDAIVSRIPLIRTIHAGVKQLLETIFSPNGQSFRKVLLVEYPRAGMWTLAFQTGDSTPEVDQALSGETMVSMYVPTTPNPTSGFLIMMPRKNVIELNMSVDQALKFVISLGVVQPGSDAKKSKKKIDKVDERYA